MTFFLSLFMTYDSFSYVEDLKWQDRGAFPVLLLNKSQPCQKLWKSIDTVIKSIVIESLSTLLSYPSRIYHLP